MPPANRAEGPPGPPAEPEPRTRDFRIRMALWLYSTAVLLYAADRITKVMAESSLRGEPGVTLIPGILQLQYTTNSGGAFGLFGGATWLFLTATFVVGGVIVFSSLNLPNRSLAVALGLVLGGALGNLTDRAIRGDGFSGRVVDFLAIATGPDEDPLWPVFNLADAAIVAGAGLILVGTAARTRRSEG